jgi:hypothetical protein
MGLATILAKISIRFETVAGNGRKIKEDDKPDVEAEPKGGEGAEHLLQAVQGKEQIGVYEAYNHAGNNRQV